MVYKISYYPDGFGDIEIDCHAICDHMRDCFHYKLILDTNNMVYFIASTYVKSTNNKATQDIIIYIESMGFKIDKTQLV